MLSMQGGQAKTRSRATTACRACRRRRTKCDNQKPFCGHCRTHGLDCYYEGVRKPSNIETELAAINQKLDYISRHVTSSSDQEGASATDADVEHQQNNQVLTEQEKAPFQLLGTECIMTIFGMEPGFARQLLRLERDASLAIDCKSSPLRNVQQQQAFDALAAFSAHVHPWYPILRPGFSEGYHQVISGPLMPGSESCLALLAVAIGFLVQQDWTLGVSASGLSDVAEQYVDAAMSSLPAVIAGRGILSVQSLLLLSLYHCCALKPCQAYDYATIASIKCQNLLKTLSNGTGELYEQAKRAFWAILILESELRVQFDLVESGIWNQDDQVNLPDSRRAWRWDTDVESPLATSPATSVQSAQDLSTDKTQAYFLAEIAMRRMLHRCNTAIHSTAQGQLVYAPHIAIELELQLDEWYRYLPGNMRFDSDQDLNFDLLASPSLYPPVDSFSNFLRVQYYCCKISIYWPAVYQCIKDEAITYELSQGCERFFNAYIQLMPSILISVRECIVNRWTLYASIFMTSMAAMQATRTNCIREGCRVDWVRLIRCIESTRTVDSRIIVASPSLSLLASRLSQCLTQFLGDEIAVD